MEIREIEGLYFIGGEDKEITCTVCGIDNLGEGYICEDNDKIILCEKCGREYNIARCKHDISGEHRHIKFRRGNFQKN